LWASTEEIEALPLKASTYLPRMDASERDRLVSEWRSAVRQAITRKIV
jgi:hypothetical protein